MYSSANPIAILLITRSTHGNTLLYQYPPPSSFNSYGEILSDTSLLQTLLAPLQAWNERKFELMVDRLLFLGRPVFLPSRSVTNVTATSTAASTPVMANIRHKSHSHSDSEVYETIASTEASHSRIASDTSKSSMLVRTNSATFLIQPVRTCLDLEHKHGSELEHSSTPPLKTPTLFTTLIAFNIILVYEHIDTSPKSLSKWYYSVLEPLTAAIKEAQVNNAWLQEQIRAVKAIKETSESNPKDGKIATSTPPPVTVIIRQVFDDLLISRRTSISFGNGQDIVLQL